MLFQTYTRPKVLFALILVFNCFIASAQVVSTFLTGNGLNGPDGFTLDSAGNLFVANWGGGYGTTVLKITPDAHADTFNNTCNAPDGLAFDAEGNLYISNYATGIISRITISGTKTVYATGFNKPSALVFDSNGNLYVSNYGGTTISKITSAGTVSTYASGFSAPLGLVFDPEGNLYVSNYNTGIVNKVLPDGTSTVFASVPNGASSKIQYLVRGASGNIYLPAYGHNKIYKITADGIVSVFAGTGVPGGKDGPVDSAQFNGPNSIALTEEGDLFVSEYNAGRIRMITGVEFPLGINDHKGGEIQGSVLFQNYPNPFRTFTTIPCHLESQENSEIRIYNLSGKEVYRSETAVRSHGDHSFTTGSWHPEPGIYLVKLMVNGKTADSKKAICN